MDLTEAARIRFLAAERGDFSGFAEIAPAFEGHPATSVAWSAALNALRWSFDPNLAIPPTVDEISQIASTGPQQAAIASRACAVMERAHIAAVRPAGLAKWLDVHEAVVAATAGAVDSDGRDEAACSGVSLRSARLWQRLWRSGDASVDRDAETLLDEAMQLGLAGVVIESTALRALCALARGELPRAVELGRRASRMAQAEALPHHECLANLTLARVRRYAGRPHLALHILAALARVAPPVFSGWTSWEMLLGGGDGVSSGGATSPGDASESSFSASARDANATAGVFEAAADLAALLQANRAGSVSDVGSAAAALGRSAAVWNDLANEADALVAAVNPAATQVPEAMVPWIRGDNPTIPFGLHGVGVPREANAEPETATAFVFAQPGRAGRRFLRPGLAIAPPAHQVSRDARAAVGAMGDKGAAAGQGVRTETGIAVLALAGPDGLSRSEFFRRVYGFPFVAQRHQTVLDVLCHRMRAVIGDAGEIRREQGDAPDQPEEPSEAVAASPGGEPALALTISRPIIVADTRCLLPAADRVLRSLATVGGMSAGDAAKALRMPLRTVQAVLQQLVAEGACSVERDGRRISYHIEDTTFTFGGLTPPP